MFIVFEPTKYYRYAFEYPFNYETLEFCRSLKQKWGWKSFNFFEKKWRFNHPGIIDDIRQEYPSVIVDEKVQFDMLGQKHEFAVKEKARENALEIKKKKMASIEVKGLKLPLYEFQKLGVEFIINNNGRAMLADVMGLGKSVQALAYVINDPTIERTLVICPASVKYVWEQEVIKWSSLTSQTIVGSDLKDNTRIGLAEVTIINYDLVKKFLPLLQAIRFDCLVLDEAHFLKNSAAHRTKAVKMLAKDIEKRVLLSGTPILNRPIELFNGLQLVDPDQWNSWIEFTKRYCDGKYTKWGWDVSGSSNIDELRSRIQHYFLRRTKEEVLPELPPKQYTDVPVHLSSKALSHYQMIERSFVDYLMTVKDKTAGEVNRSLMAEQITKLNELRYITTKGKIDAAYDIVQGIVDSDEKVVVFSCYNEPLLNLKQTFGDKAVLLIGETSAEERKRAIELFQNDPEVKVFLGGIKSAGVGLTLTASPNVVFIDYSWVPADHAQASDRIHRIGQVADSVNIYQLYVPGTVDDKMRKLLSEKEKIFNELVDGAPGSGNGNGGDSVTKQLIDMFSN